MLSMRLTVAWTLALACAIACTVRAGEGELAPLPAGARVMSGRVASVQSLSLSSDGKRAVMTADDGALRVYDTDTCKELHAFETVDASAYRACFSRDGTKIFLACDGVVRELDSTTGKETRVLEGHHDQVKAIAVSWDGLRLAATDSQGIRIWDLKNGKQVTLLSGHKVPEIIGGLGGGSALSIEGLAFSPDGRAVVSEANDESARLWNVLSGKTTRVLTQHDGSTAAVALSPDGSLGASTRGQGRLRIWDVAGGRYVRVIHAHTLDITCVVFAADGRSILTGGHDLTVRQWDLETGIELRRFTLKSQPVGIACTPDANTAITASGLEGLIAWDLNAPPVKVRGGEELANADDAWKFLTAGTYEERARGILYFTEKKDDGAAELGRKLGALAPAAADVELQRQLIGRLNDPNYTLRAQAYDRLLEIGAGARPELVSALDHPALEVRTRAAALLNALGGSQDFRGIVALEALASIQSPAARKEIERVAALKVPLAAPAKAILERLDRLNKTATP